MVIIPILLVFFGFFVVFYSSTVDFLTTYLPERLVKYSIPLGIAGWLIFGIFSKNISFAFSSIYLTAFAFLLGGSLYLIRHWASGDMWLLSSASATLGPAFPGFFPNFFLFTAIWAGILGIAYYFYFFVKHEMYKKHQAASILFLAALGIFLIRPFNNLALVGMALFFLLLVTKKDFEELFVLEKKVKNIEEDDWLIEDLKIKNRVFKASFPIGRKEAEWISKNGRGKIQIRTGVPMTPAFSFALVTLLLF